MGEIKLFEDGRVYLDGIDVSKFVSLANRSIEMREGGEIHFTCTLIGSDPEYKPPKKAKKAVKGDG